MVHTIRILLLFTCAYFVSIPSLHSQIHLKGTVYDKHGVLPMQSVTVLSSSGAGTVTDSAGKYEINVSRSDSVWFSYLGKETQRFAVKESLSPGGFNISLSVSVPVLQEVLVRQRDYKADSVQNRIDYAKAFNFKKPTIKTIVTSVSITGLVIDIDELIRAFQTRKNRSMANFRDRLVEQEQNKFIDRKFSRPLIKRITGITNEDSLSVFMEKYRPSFSFMLMATDYELQEYISSSYKNFTLK